MEILDLLIVGAGPIGLCTALEAKKKNLNYLVVEKGTTVNSLYNYPLYMQFFSTADRLEIAGVPFISTGPKPGRKDALEYYGTIARSNKLNIHHYEKVESITKVSELFEVKTSKSDYLAKNVVLATGFYDFPNKVNIPGEELEKVNHYYSEPYPYSGQKLVVVGASNSAVDAALECYRKGAEVTMIIRSSEISSSVKYWVKPDIDNRIGEGTVKAHFNSELIEIKEDSVVFKDSNGKTEDIENDFVLLLTGYLPDFKLLEASGVELSGATKEPIYNPETMETNVRGLFLAGVVCGGLNTHLWFIENSRVHANLIIEEISKRA